MSTSASFIRPAIPLDAATPQARNRNRALLFATVIMAASLFLQRFGLPAGGKTINIVGVIGMAAAAVGLARGVLSFSRVRLVAFLLLAVLVLAGLAWHQISPARFQAAPSLASVLQFLILSSFATLSFAAPVSERDFFRRVNAVFALIAVAGIVQFALQFAGVRIFAFTGLVPAAFLTEAGFNLQIPIGVGNLLKSNGFFMVEPSVFSQFMTIALIVEILAFRRPGFLALFAGGLLLSMSGTGWIVLASFVATASFSMGRRGAVIAAATLAMLMALVGAVSVLAPDIAAAFTARLGEVFQQSTSGHMRFVTPFWLLDDVFARDPAAWLLGIGGGVSEQLTLPYEYDVQHPGQDRRGIRPAGIGRLHRAVRQGNQDKPAEGAAGAWPGAAAVRRRLPAVRAWPVSDPADDLGCAAGTRHRSASRHGLTPQAFSRTNVPWPSRSRFCTVIALATPSGPTVNEIAAGPKAFSPVGW